MNNETMMKAMYEQRKRSVYLLHREYPEENYSVSYVFAVTNDVYPLLNDFDCYDDDVFNNYLRVDKNKMRAIFDLICNAWENKEVITFYKIEDAFGGKENRMILIRALRYFYLESNCSRFDNEFWINIATGPAEAGQITKPFENRDLTLG